MLAYLSSSFRLRGLWPVSHGGFKTVLKCLLGDELGTPEMSNDGPESFGIGLAAPPHNASERRSFLKLLRAALRKGRS